VISFPSESQCMHAPQEKVNIGQDDYIELGSENQPARGHVMQCRPTFLNQEKTGKLPAFQAIIAHKATE